MKLHAPCAIVTLPLPDHLLCQRDLRGVPRSGGSPARPAHANQFGCHSLGAGCEHRTDEAHHQTKGGILIGQHFGVAFVEADVQAPGLGTGARLLDRIRGNVSAGEASTGVRRGWISGPRRSPRRACASWPGREDAPRTPARLIPGTCCRWRRTSLLPSLFDDAQKGTLSFCTVKAR